MGGKSLGVKGRTEPRLYLPPLRELTPQTSKGFEVIEFAHDILGIRFYPWQEWLLIHGLELLGDNRTYRFNQVVVQVARQNGKTTLMSALAAWWLWIQSGAYEEVDPKQFKIVGCAQNLDIARETFGRVAQWADPKPLTAADQAAAIPILQAETERVTKVNGKENIVASNLAHYELRAASNARGKPAARVLFDELREIHTFDPWDALSQTTKAFYNSQLWATSNAGSEQSVVLRAQYDLGVSLIDSWRAQVEEGHQSAQDWLASCPNPFFGLFDWSAPPECAWDDENGILQANPSIGYGEITVKKVIASRHGWVESKYRTECLCQWVASVVETYIQPSEWGACEKPALEINIRKGSRTVWAIDTAIDRSMTYVAAAVETEQGMPFVTVWEARVGTLWVVPFLVELAKESGFREVVIQAKGAPAMEFIQPLKDAGLDVHEVAGSWFGVATGRLRDRVQTRDLMVVEQPAVSLAVSGGITKRFGETDAWNRAGSAVDISPLVALTLALYGLETMEPSPASRSAYSGGGLMILD